MTPSIIESSSLRAPPLAKEEVIGAPLFAKEGLGVILFSITLHTPSKLLYTSSLVILITSNQYVSNIFVLVSSYHSASSLK